MQKYHRAARAFKALLSHHISERASAAARSAASASEHSCNVRVCTYVDTMYTFNLYMYQKSFEVPTMWSYVRKRKYYLVHPVTQAQVSEV